MQKPVDLFASLLLIAVGIAIVISGARFGLGSVTEPQPGLFPFLAGMTLTILSTILFLQSWTRQTVKMKVFGNRWRPVTIILGLVTYVCIFETVGYLLSTLLMAMVALRALETKSWRELVLFSLIFTIGSYILFDRLLGVPLPEGITPMFF